MFADVITKPTFERNVDHTGQTNHYDIIQIGSYIDTDSIVLTSTDASANLVVYSINDFMELQDPDNSFVKVKFNIGEYRHDRSTNSAIAQYVFLYIVYSDGTISYPNYTDPLSSNTSLRWGNATGGRGYVMSRNWEYEDDQTSSTEVIFRKPASFGGIIKVTDMDAARSLILRTSTTTETNQRRLDYISLQVWEMIPKRLSTSDSANTVWYPEDGD